MNGATWELGVERESSPGVYATLAAITEGWTVWRFETVRGVYPVAVKTIEGGQLHVPLGVAQATFGGTPCINVQVSVDKVQAFISGAHAHAVKREMRIEGDRFFQPVPFPLDPLPFDGKRLEVYVSSMPTARSFSKSKEERGVIDLTGLSSAIEIAKGLLQKGG